MNELTRIFAQILVGIVIAATSSLITVRLALRRYRSETLWNKKLEAYLKILDALHAQRLLMESNFFNECRRGGGQGGYSDEHMAGLREIANSAQRELQRVADIGALIVAPAVVDCLKEALKTRWDDDSDPNPDFVAYFENEEKILRAAADQVLILAREDLKK